MSDQAGTTDPPNAEASVSRRDFLYISAGAFTAVGAAIAMWPFIDSMNPSADTIAVATTEVDLAPIALGQRITVLWRGKPVFIVHRTPEQIAAAEMDNRSALPDPATDQSRVKRPEWLIVVGICTHLGCVPQGQLATAAHGDYGGWFCSCHGSQYDISGRIRRGPAPRNLEIPPYSFVTDTQVAIG